MTKIIKKRYMLVITIFVITSMILLIFDWIKFDIAQRTNNLAIGTLTWIIYLLYGGAGIFSVIFLIRNFKDIKWRSYIPITSFVVTILCVFFIPYTNLYLHINYTVNLKWRAEIVEMVKLDAIQSYQLGENKYMVPYRTTSHTGTMFVQKRENVTKVMFYIYHGINKSRVLIYVSDDSSIEKHDFNFGTPYVHLDFNEIEKLNVHWYSAIVTS